MLSLSTAIYFPYIPAGVTTEGAGTITGGAGMNTVCGGGMYG